MKVYSRRDESSSLHDNKIYSIYKTSEGDLLVGTTLGMLRYDRAGDSFSPIPVFEGMFITDIAEDTSGDLWVATYANGLIRYDPAAGADRTQLHLCRRQSACAAEQQGALGLPRQHRPHLGDDVQRGDSASTTNKATIS